MSTTAMPTRPHYWRPMDVAEAMSWSTLALAGGETSGPGVAVDQCDQCGLVRFTADGDEEPTVYCDKGALRLAEPRCGD
jgi:hypothetical protein